MALSKRAKIWTIILSIPVVLVIAAIIGLKLYFTSDRLKAFVLPKIQEQTHRTVAVSDISLSVFPSIGVSVEGLRISNPQGATFEHDQFLSLDKLLINVKILPLLQGRFEILNILLDHPKIFLEVTASGKKNYSSGKKGEAAKEGEEAKGGGSFLLSNFEINDGEIELVDKKFDSRMIISGLSTKANVEGPPLEGMLHFRVDATIDKFSYGTVKSTYISELPLSATMRVTYDGTKDVLTLDAVSARLKELPLAVTGTISKLQADPLLDLSITTPQVQLTQLLSLVPPEMLKAAKGLTSTGDVKFSVTVKGVSSETMNPEIKGSFTVADGKIQYASLPKSITGINLAGTFEKPAAPIGATGIGSFSLQKLSAILGSNTIAGTLSIKNFSDPSLSANVTGSINMGEVKEYYPLEQGTELNGALRANVSLEGKVKTPASIKANGRLEFQDVTIKSATSKRPLRNLNGAITFNNQVVESKQLALNIGESDLSLSFVMKNYMGMVMEEAAKSGKPNASVTLTSKQLRTEDLMSETSGAEATSETKKNESNEGGLLPGFDIDANVTIGKLVTEKFEFANVRGSVSISNGVVTLKNLVMNAFDGAIATKGTLDLRQTKKRPFDLDLDVNGVESNVMLPKFTSFGNNLFGKLTMKTNVQGDLNDTLGLDTKSLLGNGSVQVADGKLMGFPLTAKLSDVTGVSQLREVDFKNWSNTFAISNGRINIKDLKVNAGTTDFLVAGSQGLDGSMDYNLNVKLPESVSGQLKLQGVASQLVQYFKDKEGRINLNFQVSGMTSNPSLKLDTRAQEDVAKHAVDQKKQQLLEEGKKKVEEGLKKLFKKPL